MEGLRVIENSDEQPMVSEIGASEEEPSNTAEDENNHVSRTASVRSAALDSDEIEYLEQLSNDENWSNQKPTKARRGRPARRQKQPAKDRSRSRLSRPRQEE